MAAQNPAFCIQADAHSAELFRRAVGTLIGGNTLGTPGGCIAPADLAVTAGSGNSVSVATGECWIPGSSASHMGAYYGYNDATVNLGVTPNASNPLYATTYLDTPLHCDGMRSVPLASPCNPVDGRTPKPKSRAY